MSRAKYVGTKIVSAEPMTRFAFKEFKMQDASAPIVHDPKEDEDGYLVIYADGYQSWSPKMQFEEAYIELANVEGLAPHQVRVVAEWAELRKKGIKLDEFITSNPKFKELDVAEQTRLVMQNVIMRQYADLLIQRITAWSQS